MTRRLDEMFDGIKTLYAGNNTFIYIGLYITSNRWTFKEERYLVPGARGCWQYINIHPSNGTYIISIFVIVWAIMCSNIKLILVTRIAGLCESWAM